MTYVTDHAAKRTKERVGLPKRVVWKNAERALSDGIKHGQTRGALRRYLDGLYFKRETANNIRVYCDYVYIFHNEMLITVFPLPKEYKRTADKLWREIRNNGER